VWQHFIGVENGGHSSMLVKISVLMSGEGTYKLSYCELEEVNAGY
jgi:hypothetical protein